MFFILYKWYQIAQISYYMTHKPYTRLQTLVRQIQHNIKIDYSSIPAGICMFEVTNENICSDLTTKTPEQHH